MSTGIIPTPQPGRYTRIVRRQGSKVQCLAGRDPPQRGYHRNRLWRRGLFITDGAAMDALTLPSEACLCSLLDIDHRRVSLAMARLAMPNRRRMMGEASCERSEVRELTPLLAPQFPACTSRSPNSPCAAAASPEGRTIMYCRIPRRAWVRKCASIAVAAPHEPSASSSRTTARADHERRHDFPH